MAFGQIDPARLDGDALRQWYLRSPDEIDGERQQAASRAYDAFFLHDDTQSDGASQATPAAPIGRVSDDADVLWRQVGPSRSRGERATGDSARSPVGDSGSYQLASAAFPPWGRLPILGCANCHDPQSGALRPSGPTPTPPIYSPRSGGTRGYGGGPEPDRGDKKECEQQLETDSQICGRLPRLQDIAICRGTASDRYAYCRRPDGTIGFPHLETKGGRRP